MNNISEKNKKELLKKLFKRTHEGIPIKDVKEEFKELIKDTTPAEISQIEEDLIKEGVPREEIHKLCDVHIELLKESLEKEKIIVPPGHPVNILMEEHKMILNFASELKKIAENITPAKDRESLKNQMEYLNHVKKHLKSSESHYIREENVLFPYLEKHGITQPPAIMWMEHDQIREIKKDIYKLIESENIEDIEKFAKQLEEVSIAFAEMVTSHCYKENNILFPTALNVITDTEWKEIRKQFDDLGYCCFTPKLEKIEAEVVKETSLEVEMEGLIQFESGSMTIDELEPFLDALPVDVTFVDKEDTVRYFNQPKDRFFPRTKAVIGRKVQQCHPQKSIHIVSQILEDFENKKRDSAEFWINMKGRLIYIRYFPVRGKNDEYLGCLEVTQDITDIQKIKGENRLLSGEK